MLDGPNGHSQAVVHERMLQLPLVKENGHVYRKNQESHPVRELEPAIGKDCVRFLDYGDITAAADAIRGSLEKILIDIGLQTEARITVMTWATEDYLHRREIAGRTSPAKQLQEAKHSALERLAQEYQTFLFNHEKNESQESQFVIDAVCNTITKIRAHIDKILSAS